MNRRTSGLLVLLASGLALASSACVAQTSGESGDVASTRPDTGADEMPMRVAGLNTRLLRNSGDLQAVWHAPSRTFGVVFAR